MKISDHIEREALDILERKQTLPKQITSAPKFYVARIDDKSILAFGAVAFDGCDHKIGVKRIG